MEDTKEVIKIRNSKDRKNNDKKENTSKGRNKTILKNYRLSETNPTKNGSGLGCSLSIYTPGKKYCNTPIFLLIKLCDTRGLFLTEIYYKFDSNASNWITGTKKDTFTITKTEI